MPTRPPRPDWLVQPSPARVTVAPLAAEDDLSPLWARCFEDWPLPTASLHAWWRGSGHAWVARDDRGVVGALSLDEVRGVAHVRAVAVHPRGQRRGVATALLGHGLCTISAEGVRMGGGRDYLWPGPPAGCDAAIAFARARGMPTLGQCHDLVGSASLAPASRAPGVRVALGRGSDRAAVLGLVQRELSAWTEAYRRASPQRMVLAWRGGEVVGVTLVTTAEHGAEDGAELRWRHLHEGGKPAVRCGALGSVGVAQSARRAGIGRSLVAGALGELRRRGVQRVIVRWTSVPEWYTALGFRVWRDYVACATCSFAPLSGGAHGPSDRG
ncbi:MAG: GNAT family N-acetyltransferase [Myxococcales bacterium]|nr:GNAT family N-acetyltransferase [Myxococcales bacterium]